MYNDIYLLSNNAAKHSEKLREINKGMKQNGITKK